MKNHPVIPLGRRWALAAASAGGAIALAAAMVPATSAVAATDAATSTHISGTATYHLRLGHVSRVELSAHGLRGLALHAAVKPRGALGKALTTPSGVHVVPFRSPDGPYPAGKDLGGLSGNHVASSALASRAVTSRTTGVSIIHSFNGISDGDQALVNGGLGAGEVTPPDQGLCVGFDHSLPGAPKVVFEIVNDAVAEYHPNGALIAGPVSTAEILINAFSDPRCIYDPKTASFYFTEIGVVGSGPDAGNSADDVTVLNGHGLAAYQFDSSEGGNCLGDQPKTGYDNNALVISTDQYCGSSQTEIGAQVLLVSKPQLVAEDPTLSFAQGGDFSLGGVPVVGMDPAINTTTGTSYLVNSFPYTAAGNNNALSKSLGLWKLTGDRAVNTGSGSITLTGKVIGSEQYAFPVPAESTGDGSVSTVDGLPITSEAFLNPDDSRLSAPVNVTVSEGVVQLWTALDSAVLVSGSPVAVDGAAWFKINTGTQKVASQGYVAQKGANLLYPALLAPASGPAAMVFTITSHAIQPSAAYTTLGSGKVTIVGAGNGPHVSFSDALFNQARWGDYSWAGIDPGTNGIWMATEYIPPTPHQDPIDNWGTFVFKLSK